MSNFKNALSKFHGDEAGNESIQTVAILAVGAMVLIGVMSIWNNDVKTGVVGKIGELFGLSG